MKLIFRLIVTLLNCIGKFHAYAFNEKGPCLPPCDFQYTVKPQNLKHGNFRTVPKILTRISVPTKNALNSTSSSSKKSHTVKLELSNTFHGSKHKITILLTWERSNKGLADRLVDKCC